MNDQRKRKKKQSKSTFIKGKLALYEKKKRYANSLETHLNNIDSILTISSIYPVCKMGEQVSNLTQGQNLSLKKINKLKRGQINKTVHLMGKQNWNHQKGIRMSFKSSENNKSLGNEQFSKKWAKGARYSHNPNSICRQQLDRGDQHQILEVYGAKMSIYNGSEMECDEKGGKNCQQTDKLLSSELISKPIQLITVGRSKISQSQTLYFQSKKSKQKQLKQPTMIINSINIRNNKRNQSYTLNLNSNQSYFYSLTEKNNASSVRREKAALWKTWEARKCHKEQIKKNSGKLKLHRTDSPHFSVCNSVFITAK